MLLLLASLAHAEDLYVSSNVKGAEIYLNGVATGLKTPATLTGVAPGTVEVSVESGCARGSATVTVQRGVPNRVGLVAMAEDATITINPDPVQARLFLDDQPYPGRVGAPLAIECGEHVVRAELEGYVASSLQLELGGGEDRELTIELEELALATIDLSVQPRDATLTLDGNPVGTDAASLPSVAVGGHVFGAEYEGYKTAAIEVVVTEGEEQAWHFTLAGENGKKESTATQIRGPKPGLVVDASGPSAAKIAATSSSSTKSSSGSATSSKSTTSSAYEGLDEEPEEAPAKSSTSKTSSEKTSSEKASSEKASSEKASSEKASSEKTSSEKKSSSGGDYYSRLRSDEETAEEASSTKPASSSSSSSSSSKSSSSTSTKSSTSSKSTEPVDADVPSRYEDLDEPATTSSSKKSSKDETSDKDEKSARDERSSKDEKSAKSDRSDDDGGKSKVGLDITGVTMMVLGAGSAGGAVYFWDRTTVAYDAYNAKVDAAEASGDKALEKAASDYYDNVLVPKRNAMYGTAAGAGVLGVTGLVLVLVDDRMPVLAPLPQGGAMLSWGTRF